VLARELAQAGEEFAPLRQQAVIGRQRLDDEGRDARTLTLKQLLERRFVIERQHARAGRERFRHARGGWAAEGGESRARRHQQVIRMPVIAAGEFDDRSEEHTSELQSLAYLVCRLLLEKKKKIE